MAFPLAAVSISYFLTTLLALQFPDANRVLASVWPAGGIALAALLLTRRGRWLPIMAGVLVAGLAADMLSGRPLANSLGFMSANVAESLLCAFALQRWRGEDLRFDRVADVIALVFAATICNAVTAMLGSGTAWLADRSSFWRFWLTWWIADGLGILLITPLIVTTAHTVRSSRGLGWKAALEASAFTAIWCAVSWLTFQKKTSPILIVPQPFMIFALLTYAALRFKMHGTSGLILLLSAILLTSSSVRDGGLIWGGDTAPQRVLLAQIFIACVIVTGFFLCAVFAERKRVEKELFEAKAELETIIDVAPLAITLIDRSGKVQIWNPAARVMFDWSREEVMGKPNPIVPPYMEAEYRDLSEMVLRGEPIAELETVRRRRDGSLIDVSLSSAAIYDDADVAVGRMAILADITGRKRAEAELKTSLAEKEILLRELYHRTKNNMNVIISLLDMQSAQCGDENLSKSFDEAKNRIYCMALVHQKLYESGDLSRIGLGKYLSELCRSLLSSYGLAPHQIALREELKDIQVLVDVAIPCGLIANELVSNALKYAFPGSRLGTIAVILDKDDDDEIVLKIADDGVGMSDFAGIKQHMKMGLRTVVGLGETQLGGRVAFSSDPGFACEIRFSGRLYSARV
jgi:PAS domain S-box-containing protein